MVTTHVVVGEATYLAIHEAIAECWDVPAILRRAWINETEPIWDDPYRAAMRVVYDRRFERSF